MGCGASSLPQDGADTHGHSGAKDGGGKGATGEATRQAEDKNGGEDGNRRGGAGNGADGQATAAGTAGAPGAGGHSSTTSQGMSTAAAASSFSTHVITDQRGCKVSTVIQNRNKVETMCKWADNVLKARSAAGGVFLNPQDGRIRRSQVSQPQESNGSQSAGSSMANAVDTTRDTASVSSRHGGVSRATEYGSMVSNTFLGVSTTGAGGNSQSRGNLTNVAQHGSEGDQDIPFSPARVEGDTTAPLPPLPEPVEQTA